MEKVYYYKKKEITDSLEDFEKKFTMEQKNVIDEEFYKNNHANNNYGVFATRDLHPGELIDTCMYVGCTSDIADTNFGKIYTYTMSPNEFGWEYCVVGGVGMFFNNGIEPELPNVAHRHLPELRSFQYYTTAFVEKDEELFTDYGHSKLKIKHNYKAVERNLINWEYEKEKRKKK